MGSLAGVARHQVLDVGAYNEILPDYPPVGIFREPSGQGRARGPGRTRAVLICGSGVGATVAANKTPRHRAGSARTLIRQSGVGKTKHQYPRLGARITGENLAEELVRSYMSANHHGDATSAASQRCRLRG